MLQPCIHDGHLVGHGVIGFVPILALIIVVFDLKKSEGAMTADCTLSNELDSAASLHT